MLKNYFKIALRNVHRYKTYSIINVTGLAAGITCCLFIVLYLNFELSYDRQHELGDRIYRLVSERTIGNALEHVANAPFPAGPRLAEEYPEIAQGVRLFRATNGASISFEDKVFVEDLFFFADENTFDVFTYEFVKGTAHAALIDPQSVVITERVAEKYFGNEDPMGQTITARLLGQSGELIVSGVLKNPSANSHIQFDFLAPFDSELNGWQGAQERWDTGTLGAWTYFLLAPGQRADLLEDKFPDFVQSHLPESVQHSIKFSLQPLFDIHLHSQLSGELEVNGNVLYIFVFAIIALAVLTIACVNYVNLTAAHSFQRAREVGMRKTMGAQRAQLAVQFLGEALILSLLAFLLALFITRATLPYFISMTGKPLSLNLISGKMIVYLVALWLITGIASGGYPAFVLSRYQPVEALKRKSNSFTPKKLSLRSLLVISQFAISTVLVISLWTIFDQVNYIKNKGLGFNKEQLIVIAGPNGVTFDVLKNELLSDPGILGVTVTSRVPGGRQLISSLFLPDGGNDSRMKMQHLNVEKDFIKTFQFEMIEGSDFDGRMNNTIILNEAAAKEFGWGAGAVGKELVHFTRAGEERKRVIGVIKDVHYESLYTQIKPLVLSGGINYGSRIIARISPENTAETLDFLEHTWSRLSPDSPLDFYFLDEDINRIYLQEERLSKVLQSFTWLALFVTYIGLFGLVAFFAQQRTKEVGIRKVLGASVSSILLVLSRQFASLILLSLCVALPVAYVITNHWLQNFAYHITISIWTFIGAAGFTLLLALLTISARTVRAALVNPVQVLQQE